MDRVDGLVAAASAAGLIGLAINVHAPARALLLGLVTERMSRVPQASASPTAEAVASGHAHAGAERKRVSVLGATGSVGRSTLDLIGRNPRYVRSRRADRQQQCRRAWPSWPCGMARRWPWSATIGTTRR